MIYCMVLFKKYDANLIHSQYIFHMIVISCYKLLNYYELKENLKEFPNTTRASGVLEEKGGKKDITENHNKTEKLCLC